MDKLCRYINREMEELESKVSNGGKLSGAELEYADKLAHLKKSILTNEAMEGEYSNTYPHYRESYGRRRDSMGRYSRDEARTVFLDEVYELRDKAPDEHTRKKIERIIEEMK